MTEVGRQPNQAEAKSTKCIAMKIDGAPCKAPAVTSNGSCWAHDPSRENARSEARSKGGRNKSRAARLEKLMPPRLKGVYEILEESLREVRAGTLDPKCATALSSLAGAMIRVLEAGETQERIRQLEDRLREDASP